ncbi:AB hydrolase superfamily protein YfhM-like isoform X1 [Amblyomma americanum]
MRRCREAQLAQAAAHCRSSSRSQRSIETAAMAFKTLRRALSRILLVTVGACMGLWTCLRIGVQVLLKGKSILTPKQRPEEPACLRDPALGTHKFVTLEAVTLHYVSAGSQENPLLLFLHGFPDTWYTWEKQIRHFQKDHWVVAVDMRGCGQSTKPQEVEDYLMSHLVEDIKGLILSLGCKKATVVGHDLGGIVAWVLATKHEDLVNRLVVINGPHPLAFRYQLENSFAQMLKSWYMVTFQSPKLPEAILKVNDFELIDKALGPYETDIKEVVKHSISQPGALTAALNHYRALWRRDQRLQDLRFRYLNTPTLIVWGQRDQFLTLKLAQLSILQAFGRVEYLADAGHWVHREKAERVNDLIRQFFKNTEDHL